MQSPARRASIRVCVNVFFLTLYCLTVGPPSALAAGSRGVLIIRGESPDLPGGRIIIDTIEATVRRSSVAPVEFYIESIDTGRFTGPLFEQRVADLFAEKYSAVPLVLVVAFGGSAVQFALREHDRLFPSTPM